MLLQSAAKIDIRDGRGFLVLYVAIFNEYVDCVRLLLNYSADVNSQIPACNVDSFTLLITIVRTEAI